MANRPTLRQHIRYRVDNALARSVWVLLIWLIAISILVAVIVTAVLYVFNLGPEGQSFSFEDGLGQALNNAFNPDNFSDSPNVGHRIGMTLLTIMGIFVAAAVVGTIAAALDSRIEDLRRGRSRVLERGHALIIGDTSQLPIVVRELVEANVSRRGRAIVVLTTEDTVETRERILRDIDGLRSSRLIIRSGSLTSLSDLNRCSPRTASSIIVLAPEPPESPALAVKTVLALHALLNERPTRIVAEIPDPNLAKALVAAVGDRVMPVVTEELIARMTARALRTSGLGTVFEDLLSFDDRSEIYTCPIPETYLGRTFGELLLGSSRATILGIWHADGDLQLDPPVDHHIEVGDRAIGIADDQSLFTIDLPPQDWDMSDLTRWPGAEITAERTLMLGWSDIAPNVIRELDRCAGPGSQLTVLVDPELDDPESIRASIDGMELSATTLDFRTGSSIELSIIDPLLANGFDNIVILSESGRLPQAEADARVLISAMHIENARLPLATNVLAEIHTPEDVEIAAVGEQIDFIVSSRMASLLMVQFAEQPELRSVFDDLIGGEHLEITMFPFEHLGVPSDTTFGEIVHAARSMSVIAIGYTAAAGVGQEKYLRGGIRLSPPRNEPVHFQPGDRVIVLNDIRT